MLIYLSTKQKCNKNIKTKCKAIKCSEVLQRYIFVFVIQRQAKKKLSLQIFISHLMIQNWYYFMALVENATLYKSSPFCHKILFCFYLIHFTHTYIMMWNWFLWKGRKQHANEQTGKNHKGKTILQGKTICDEECVSSCGTKPIYATYWATTAIGIWPTAEYLRATSYVSRELWRCSSNWQRSNEEVRQKKTKQAKKPARSSVWILKSPKAKRIEGKK